MRPYAANYGLPSSLQMFGWESYLTIGTVDFNEAPKRDFVFNDPFILDMLKIKGTDSFNDTLALDIMLNSNVNGFFPPNFHVWATLPSMEIVDISFLSFLWKKGFLAEKPKNFLIAEYP